MGRNLSPDVRGDLVSRLNRRRPTQREEQREPGEHALGKVALIDADMHITVKSRVEESSQAVNHSILRDLCLHAYRI